MKYRVDCWNNSLINVKKGDQVKVEGNQSVIRESLIMAVKIENLSRNEPTCQCGKPSAPSVEAKLFTRKVVKTGVVLETSKAAGDTGFWLDMESEE